ncbi:MAG TPA: DUF222 domain-containing protein [Candidatus Dormibacteraeota bacterium]|jgi:hypothetical protein
MRSGAGERGNWTSEEVFKEINSLLDRLQAEELCELPSASLGEDIKELERIGNRCQAESMRRLRRFDKDQGFAASGALTTKSWLRWQCHLTDGVASHRVELARRLPELPQTSEAYAQGSISYSHASLIAKTAEHCGQSWEANAESILVKAARELDPYQLKKACIRMRHYLEPQCVLTEANEIHERRQVFLSQTLDGVFYIDGQLDAEGGATLQTALDALMGPPAADDERTPPQRRADSLVELARRQLDGGRLPEVAGQKPHLMVNVDLATLAKQPHSPAAELEWAQPIPAETARRLACDCSLTPILHGAESHQVEAGPTTRVIPPSMRRALNARDKGCRFPGCDMPVAWCDAHHLKHWADGGPNALWNLLLLCRRHHGLFHEGGWRLEQADGGLLAVPP